MFDACYATYQTLRVRLPRKSVHASVSSAFWRHVGATVVSLRCTQQKMCEEVIVFAPRGRETHPGAGLLERNELWERKMGEKQTMTTHNETVDNSESPIWTYSPLRVVVLSI